MNKSWIFYVCNRFSRIDRKGRSKATSTLATLGITLGVMTLIVIMSIFRSIWTVRGWAMRWHLKHAM